MLTAKEIQESYLKKLKSDIELMKVIDDVTEEIYTKLMVKEEYVYMVRFDIVTAKRVAFVLRTMGFKVTEYKHGKLHIEVVQ